MIKGYFSLDNYSKILMDSTHYEESRGHGEYYANVIKISDSLDFCPRREYVGLAEDCWLPCHAAHELINDRGCYESRS